MKSYLLAVPAALSFLALGCAAEIGSETESTGSASEAVAACPAAGATDTDMRAAASAAFSIMQAAAAECHVNQNVNGVTNAPDNMTAPCWSSTILASQRYTFAADGKSIIFDTTDPQYGYVPNAAKAALQIAQVNPAMASFLVSSLQWAQKNTNGQIYPQIVPIQSLATFVYPGNSTPIAIKDPNAASRSDVVTGTAWCNTEDVHIADTATVDGQFTTMNLTYYWNFTSAAKKPYVGNAAVPTTPFNGAGTLNPYLVIAVNGAPYAWTQNGPMASCYGTSKCSGSIDIDPIPYTQAGVYMNAAGVVGTQPNPFALNTSNEFANATHQNNWATQVVGTATHGGQFTSPYVSWGTTTYQYVQQY